MHDWDLSIEEAARVQRELASSVIEAPLSGAIATVAGADVSFDVGGDTLYAAVVVLDAHSLEVVAVGRATTEARFPYVPGFLSFREIPALIEAFATLEEKPDLMICDGQGRAHPRRLGIASHLGVLLDIPTVGCAKKKLTGRYREPEDRRGATAPLYAYDGKEVLGLVLRTRERVKPVFVSVGHRVTLEQACELVLRFAPRYRLTEPVRQAHREVNRMRLEAKRADVASRPP